MVETKYNVNYPDGKWCMTTTMQGLTNVFKLSKEAKTRIEHELSTQMYCKLHFRRETPWATNEYWISYA